MRANRFLTFFLLFANWPALGQFNTAPERKDRKRLYEVFQKEICDHHEVPHQDALWRKNVYDAQIEGQILKQKENLKITAEDVEKASEVFAQRNNHYGVSRGTCKDGSHWVISTPAPEDYLITTDNLLTFEGKSFSHYCYQIEISYAAKSGGTSRTLYKTRKLNPEPIRLNLALLEPGTLSLTCKPRHPEWQGSVLWYLMPVGKLATAEIPEEALLKDSTEPVGTRLLKWVNAVRKKEGLGPVSDNHPTIQWLGEQLARNKTVYHNRHTLTKVSKLLRSKQAVFLGENRVKASDAEQMGWLLWNSPTHRSLLLDKKATHMAIAQQTLKDEQLAIMVFAQF